jgi:hypothetical protein
MRAASEHEAELLAHGAAIIFLRREHRLPWAQISTALGFTVLECRTLAAAFALTAAQQGDPIDGHPAAKVVR